MVSARRLNLPDLDPRVSSMRSIRLLLEIGCPDLPWGLTAANKSCWMRAYSESLTSPAN